MKKLILLLICFLINYSIAFAETNWQWIESDDNYSKFIAPESIEIHRDSYNNKLNYIEVWAKNIYSFSGAKEISNLYDLNISPDKLSYSIAKLKLYPQDNKIVINDIAFYGKNKDILTILKKENVYYSFFHKNYAAFLYYTLDKIADNNEYARFKSKDRYLHIASNENTNIGRLDVYLDTVAITNQGDFLKCYVWEIISNNLQPENYGKTLTLYKIYNNSKITSQTIYFKTNKIEKFMNEIPYEYRKEELVDFYPDSTGQKTMDKIKSYFYQNFDWTNRYNEGIYVGKL